MEKPQKLPKLTKKQKGFVKDYIATGNGVQSALNNYDTDDYSTAGNIASDNLNKPKIQKAILSIAEQIPDEHLVRVHIEGLNASKTIKTADDGTDIVEPDYAVRHKYLDSAYKIKRLYGTEELEKPKENVYNFFFEPKFQQNIRSYDENLKNLILNKDAQETKETTHIVDTSG